MDENVRLRWTNEITKCFLETCMEEVNKVVRNGGSLRKETWMKLATKFEEVCYVKLVQKQLKNQYDYLKRKYTGLTYLRNRTENIYDPELDTFTLSNQEWEDFFQALFEGVSTTGSRAYVPTSTREN
ncbi:uncharacterized protein LOC112506738 [Cynara cardunculus var. scolymus]|uniref:uncharacterized protein LOC112506738 n=1 Tax=Cynara cardunculus var. scolymus TaxID=59895 RepID=UPI000D628C9F|nr:uncharacterized protein LOC112506738 [Cynara cardunculus var. scolymus]